MACWHQKTKKLQNASTQPIQHTKIPWLTSETQKHSMFFPMCFLHLRIFPIVPCRFLRFLCKSLLFDLLFACPSNETAKKEKRWFSNVFTLYSSAPLVGTYRVLLQLYNVQKQRCLRAFVHARNIDKAYALLQNRCNFQGVAQMPDLRKTTKEAKKTENTNQTQNIVFSTCSAPHVENGGMYNVFCVFMPETSTRMWHYSFRAKAPS